MRFPLVCIISLVGLVGCTESEKTNESLVGDFEIVGGRESATFYGSYTIYKDGRKVGKLKLADERINFVSFSPDGQIAGELETPIVHKTEAGSSATIFVKSPEGVREGHQMIEKKIMGSDLDPAHDTLRGSVLHIAPLQE